MPIEHHGIEGILLNHAVSVLSCPCLCSKSRPLKVTDLKVWNYDGSSTGQADGHNSEVLLKPRAIFNDPFRALPLLCVVLVSCVHLIWFKRDLAFGSSGSCRGRFTDFLH